LDGECIKCDIKHAREVFEAVDAKDSVENRLLKEHKSAKGDVLFEYYDYLCNKSTLCEIIIPLYARQDYSKQRNKRGIMGILIIGQMLIQEKIDAAGDELDNFINGLTPKNRNVIDKLRKDMQKSVDKNGPQLFDTVNDALAKHEKNITKYLDSIGDRVILRETDFLHLYQAERIRDYIAEKAQLEQDGIDESEGLKKCIKNMFSQIANDFAIKHMFMFFPDMTPKIIETTDIVTGEDLVKSGEAASETHTLELDLKLFKPNQELKVKIPDIKKNGCLTWKVNNTAIEIPEEKFERGHLACYATKEREPSTFFGIFYEWEEPSQKESSDARKAFFDALVSVCLTDIMAYVAKLRSERLRSFAESTRHDLAQRLQTFEILNSSFRSNLATAKRDFMDPPALTKFFVHSERFAEDNETMHDALTFLMQTLDDPELRVSYKPEIFNPYTNILHRFRQVYNATWHKYNKGQRVLLCPQPANIWRTFADKRMFYRVMNNLMENALKYSLMGTNVYVASSVDFKANCCYFDVTNFGIGIPKSQELSIFEPRRRTKPSEDSNTDGEGLGLFISKGFAKHHTGDLYISKGLTSGIHTQEEKEANGLVSDINISHYYALQRIIKNGSNPNTRYHELLEEAEEAVNQLQSLPNTHPLVATARSYGKKNVFDFIMAEPRTEHNFQTADNQDLGAKRLSIGQKKPIYMITFTLKLPMQP